MVSIYLIKIKITTKFFKFGLLTDEKWCFGYLGHLVRTSRDLRLPPRCKSEIIPIMTSGTKLMYYINSGVTSQYLT